MTFDGNVDMLQLAFWQIILASAPVLIVALIIGLLIGVIQAATSINEMTLSFVPKVIIVILTMLFTANFVMISLADYFALIPDPIRISNGGFAPIGKIIKLSKNILNIIRCASNDINKTNKNRFNV